MHISQIGYQSHTHPPHLSYAVTQPSPSLALQVLTVTGSKYEIIDAIVSSIPEKPVTETPCTDLLSVTEPAYDEYERKEYDYSEHKFYKVGRGGSLVCLLCTLSGLLSISVTSCMAGMSFLSLHS